MLLGQASVYIKTIDDNLKMWFKVLFFKRLVCSNYTIQSPVQVVEQVLKLI